MHGVRLCEPHEIPVECLQATANLKVPPDWFVNTSIVCVTFSHLVHLPHTALVNAALLRWLTSLACKGLRLLANSPNAKPRPSGPTVMGRDAAGLEPSADCLVVRGLDTHKKVKVKESDSPG